ncbi:MAG: hypothetical protein Q8R37_04030 [Nanoarchaeota archaeon]|nr:hypothetical protein [Nanoarchaeota archaeon]
MTEFTLTKQLSKQGLQHMILIPAFLRDQLQPKMLVEVKIKVLESGTNGN